MGGHGSGGARVRSGPPPDPNALRRNREGEWLKLPAEGRQQDAPPWPLQGESPREGDIWHAMWLKPQAVAWEAFGLEWEVAFLVRSMAEAELPVAPTGLRTLVRQMMDSLGLTTPGMRANRWKIVGDELAEARGSRRESGGPVKSSRSRLKVASGGGG